jgi:hypothetical protein
MDIKSEFISDWSREKIAQGEALGRAEGEAHGRAEALLRVLRGRGFVLSEESALRIRECSDITQLDAWLDRALSVKSSDELFD